MGSALLIWFFLVSVNSSVITLIKDTNVTCILTQEHHNGTVYLNSAPEIHFKNLRSENNKPLSNDVCYYNNCWNNYKNDSLLLLFNPVMNQQWHDIPLRHQTAQVDISNGSSGFFSICTKTHFSLIFIDSTSTENHTMTIKNSQTSKGGCSLWRHFVIKPVQNGLKVNEMKSNRAYKIKDGNIRIAADHLLLDSTSLAFWKFMSNDLVYHWSNQSNNDSTSTFSIPLEIDHGLKCISFLVSIDKGCAMDFQLECDDGTIRNYSKSGFNDAPDSERQWVKVNIPFECETDLANLLIIKRRTVDISNTLGFWAVSQMQYEECTQHIEIWTANLRNFVSETDNRCLLMDSPIMDSDDCKKPGYYGTKCEFSCSEIGGDAECKGYRICQGNSVCKCGFGCSGISCNQTCLNGSWGMNCEQKCLCGNCNEFNGECPMPSDIYSNITTGFENNINAKSSTINSTARIDSKEASTTFNPMKVVPTDIATTTICLISFLIIVLLIAGNITGFIICKKFRKRKNSHDFSRSNCKSQIEMLIIGEGTNIQINNLDNYLEEELTHKDNTINQQFLRLQNDGQKPCDIGLTQRNHNRNRNPNFLPNDHRRVILRKMQGMESNDYINASYLEDNNQDRAFIATQAPKFSTIRDFWRMIWQEEVKMIIMLTNFKEFGERKCAEYWCDHIDQIKFYGKISVRLIANKPGEYFTRRTFEVWFGRHKLTVQHFQLNYQPECGQPLYTNNVTALLQHVEKMCCDSGRPVVVHCSSGSELTGTFILSALALQMANTFGRVDFFKLAQRMRQQRPNIIANLQHYVLAHMVVSECLMHCTYFENLVEKQQSELEQQIQILHVVSLHDRYVRQWAESPAQNYTVVGANKSYNFLLDKQPTRNNVTDFWRTVFSHGIKTIVFLNQSQSNYEFLFPTHAQLFNGVYCEFAIIQGCKSSQYYKQSNILIKKHDSMQNTEETTIHLLELKDWSPEAPTPLTLEHILEVLEAIDNIKIKGQPILIACSDGITANGLFVSVAWMVQRYREKSRCDLLYSARNARRNHFSFVRNIQQLAFIYNSSKEIISGTKGLVTL